jgi:uncharacterized protein
MGFLRGHQWITLMTFLLVMTLARPSAAHASSANFSEEEVQFQNGDVTLNGTVLVPEGSDRHAAIVLIHGAGPRTRHTELYRGMGEIFVNAGLVTLIYDKRTEGYSASGVGKDSRSYSLLADDALAAVEVLRARDDVDPTKIGLWGLSEGGWVAPLTAFRSSDVAFVIVLGANGIPPIQQTSWAMEGDFRHQGVRSASMLRSITFNGLRFMVASEMFAEATYDPVPVLEQLEQPILAIWGSNERSSPPLEGAQVFQESLNRGGNQHYTIQFFTGAGHDLRSAPDGFTQLDTFAPGYEEAMTSWINRVVQGEVPGPEIIGEAPEQARISPAGVVDPSGRDSGLLHLSILAILALITATYFAVALIRNFRHQATKPMRWHARLLALLLLIIPIGFFAYFIYTLMNYAAGPVFAGQPVVWLVLQLLSWLVVVLAVWLAILWWRGRSTIRGSEGARVGLLLVGSMIFVPWALHWRLLF